MLFPNDAIVMILARMIGMLGPIDQEMLEQGQETPKYFTEEYDLYYINEASCMYLDCLTSILVLCFSEGLQNF